MLRTGRHIYPARPDECPCSVITLAICFFFFHCLLCKGKRGEDNQNWPHPCDPWLLNSPVKSSEHWASLQLTIRRCIALKVHLCPDLGSKAHWRRNRAAGQHSQALYCKQLWGTVGFRYPCPRPQHQLSGFLAALCYYSSEHFGHWRNSQLVLCSSTWVLGKTLINIFPIQPRSLIFDECLLYLVQFSPLCFVVQISSLGWVVFKEGDYWIWQFPRQ